jgi:hypothetical protein
MTLGYNFEINNMLIFGDLRNEDLKCYSGNHGKLSSVRVMKYITLP